MLSVPLLAAGRAEFASIEAPAWVWVAFVALLAALLSVDLVLHRGNHAPTARRALVESMAWVACGLGFSVVVLVAWGDQAFGEYLSGYIIEKSLSVDNVFVWAIIFSTFAIPRRYQHRVLFWGIFGALTLRAAFILGGSALITRFWWMLPVFGAILIVSGVKVIRHRDDEGTHGHDRAVTLLGRFIPVRATLSGQRFVLREHGKLVATPLLAALVVIEVSDVVFAIDSVPAILAVSREPFIVFASNAFAILGLRAMYFLLGDARERVSTTCPMPSARSSRLSASRWHCRLGGTSRPPLRSSSSSGSSRRPSSSVRTSSAQTLYCTPQLVSAMTCRAVSPPAHPIGQEAQCLPSSPKTTILPICGIEHAESPRLAGHRRQTARGATSPIPPLARCCLPGRADASSPPSFDTSATKSSPVWSPDTNQNTPARSNLPTSTMHISTQPNSSLTCVRCSPAPVPPSQSPTIPGSSSWAKQSHSFSMTGHWTVDCSSTRSKPHSAVCECPPNRRSGGRFSDVGSARRSKFGRPRDRTAAGSSEPKDQSAQTKQLAPATREAVRAVPATTRGGS